jgi:site-specific recombinase XerD
MNEKNAALLKEHSNILSLRDLSRGTIATYISYMTQLIHWFEAINPLASISNITYPQIRSYMAYLKDVRKLDASTINVHMAQLHDFFIYILNRDWDPRQVPKIRVTHKLPIVPSREEIDIMINTHKNPAHKAELVLLYSSGIRISELCRLRCGDIHLKDGFIHIAISKNRCERRAILAKNAEPVLIDYIRCSYRGARKEDWLFPGKKTGCPICPETVRLHFHNHLNEIGMGDKGYYPHSLRHAFGLHLYNAGTDLMSIKEALGHKSLSSTTVYLTLGIGNGRSVVSPYDM